MTNGVLAAPAIYNKASDMGAYKANLPWWKTIILGAVAGCYVSLGGSLLLTVGPNCMGIGASNPGLQKYIIGAIGFPYALLAILTCGAELFTGNTALVTTAVLEKKATVKQLVKSWTCSYLGNAIGCAIGIFLFYNTGLMPQFHGSEGFALVKTASPLKETFVKAILANWFVCLAVWQSIAAQSFGGKFIACLGPVSAFVAVGLEHCIANMFFVPLGILAGANVTMGDFIFKNLIPVTLGNIFAGLFALRCSVKALKLVQRRRRRHQCDRLDGDALDQVSLVERLVAPKDVDHLAGHPVSLLNHVQVVDPCLLRDERLR